MTKYKSTWRADEENLCHTGISDAFDSVLDSIFKCIEDFLTRNKLSEFCSRDLDESFEIKDGVGLSHAICDMLSIDLVQWFDSYVVKPFNDRCYEIRNDESMVSEDARQAIIESHANTVLEDYVDHYIFDEMEERAKIAEARVAEIEDDWGKNSVQPQGHVASLIWNKDKQCFVCPITGRNYVLTEQESFASTKV